MAFAETADGPGVLLIERAADLRNHAGQVAFPGGAQRPRRPRRRGDRAARGGRGGRAGPGDGAGPGHAAGAVPAAVAVRRHAGAGLVGGAAPGAARSTPREVADVAVVPVRRARRPGQPVHRRAPVGLARPGLRGARAGSCGASPPGCSTGCWSSAGGRGRGTRRCSGRCRAERTDRGTRQRRYRACGGSRGPSRRPGSAPAGARPDAGARRPARTARAPSTGSRRRARPPHRRSRAATQQVTDRGRRPLPLPPVDDHRASRAPCGSP